MTKVTCPICKKQMKEINNAHLKVHSLTVKQFDEQFPSYPRMSVEQRKKKIRYQELTHEMSQRLKISHTLEGYINKYGEVEGPLRYQRSKENKQQSKTLDNFKRLNGDVDGERKYHEYKAMSRAKMSKVGFIERYGECEGAKQYNQWLKNNKKSKTLQGYIDKHGEAEGRRKWFSKNNQNSKSSRKVSERQQYHLYKTIVYRFTRQTSKNNTIVNNDLVSKGKYVIDHRYSILEGFKHSVPPYIIGSRHNLEVIPHCTNSSKQDHCSITLQELLATYFNN